MIRAKSHLPDSIGEALGLRGVCRRFVYYSLSSRGHVASERDAIGRRRAASLGVKFHRWLVRGRSTLTFLTCMGTRCQNQGHQDVDRNQQHRSFRFCRRSVEREGFSVSGSEVASDIGAFLHTQSDSLVLTSLQRLCRSF